MAGFTLAALDAILADTPEPKPTVAIETGTWKGDTTAILAERFELVDTIEIDPALAAAAGRRFDVAETALIVEVHDGDSADVLPRLLSETAEIAVAEAAFFNWATLLYLDAHRWPGVADNADNPFPLWAELAAAKACPAVRVVIVDDVLCMGQPGDTVGWATATPEAIVAAMGDRVERWEIRGDQLVAWWNGGDDA